MMLDYFYGQSGELFSYFRIPKALFQDSRFRQLSTDARTLYGILLDRMSLSAKNGWMDEQGRVYIIYTVREVQESLCCAEHKAVKLFRELEDTDLIERKRRGLGRPSLIYVKDFSSGLPKAQVQNCPNSNSGAAESAILEQPKPQANKTDKNNTEMNEPDPIHSGGIREQLEDYFYQSLEVDLLLRLCPDDEDTIYQIVDLLVDTCSTKRKMLRIAGDDKPTEVVRSRLKKLNADHIRFVLESLAENTAPVRNMKQYLLAMLYNAPTTMNLYYQNKTNHDFARGSPKAGGCYRKERLLHREQTLCSSPLWYVVTQSFFSAVRAKKLARTAPEMLCHTENTAPGMVASGYCAKWAAAREVARPEFCIPTSMEIARHLVESSFSSLPTPKPVR